MASTPDALHRAVKTPPPSYPAARKTGKCCQWRIEVRPTAHALDSAAAAGLIIIIIIIKGIYIAQVRKGHKCALAATRSTPLCASSQLTVTYYYYGHYKTPRSSRYS